VLRLSSSRAQVAACVSSVARRLARTRDYAVAAKCLLLVHRLVADGDPHFRHEVLRPAPSGRRAGEPLLALPADFRDDDARLDHHSAFVRAYAAYLGARARFLVSPLPPHRAAVHFADDHVVLSSSSSQAPPPDQPVHEMDAESVLARARQLRDLLDRVLACRPAGAARHSRVVRAALYQLLRDGFQLHADVSVALAALLDRFFDMEYPHCVKAFEAHVGAARQADELLAFYEWCRDVAAVARASDFHGALVNRVDERLLETLEQFLRDRTNQRSSLPQRDDDPEPSAVAEYDDVSSAKALPAPPESPTAQKKNRTPDDQLLVDLREEAPADDTLALALFNAPPATTDWVAFPSDNDEVATTSAWQTPAAELGKADWELALVETASNLSRQKAALGGGLDPLLLGGMYDHGAIRHHVAAQASASGSASSVAAFPGRASAAPVLALPAPDGTVLGAEDPFAASLAVPPPAYVQMAEMQRKQRLLLQEQNMWTQYRQGGMQGQPAGLANTSSVTPAVAYNQVGGYY
jgi:hypothetical protein